MSEPEPLYVACVSALLDHLEDRHPGPTRFCGLPSTAPQVIA